MNGVSKAILNRLADELDLLAFVTETEGQHQSLNGSGDLCSDLARNSCKDEDMTVDIFILALAELLRQYSKQLKEFIG